MSAWKPPTHCRFVRVERTRFDRSRDGNYWIVDPPRLDGSDSIHYSNIVPSKEPTEWLTCDYLEFSDYSGCAVERANYNVWTEDIDPGGAFTVEVLGSHGTKSLLLHVPSLSEEAREALDALEGYPCIDDHAVSEVEQLLFNDAWESYLGRDFRRAVAKELVCLWASHDLDEGDWDVEELLLEAPEPAVSRLFWDSSLNEPESFCIETGGGVYFPSWDSIVARAASWLAKDLSLLQAEVEP